MYNKVSVRDVDVTGRRVFLRVDFNVPLNSKGQITNDNRIIEALPTIKYLVEKGAKIILCSHLGRPEGKVCSEFSLKPVAERLKTLLKKPIIFMDEVLSAKTHKYLGNMENGDIIMLENVRFEPGEELNDSAFAKKLAALADVFVSDAFGTVHRENASVCGIAKFLPSCVGFLIERELEVLNKLLSNPAQPFVVVLGGVKVKDKIGLISNFINTASTLIIGGAMAYTFLAAKGINVANSKVETDKIELAKLLMDKAALKGVKLMLPADNVVAQECVFNAPTEVANTFSFPAGTMGLDIGPATANAYANEILRAKTVLWNGPMGVFEFAKFSNGTKAIVKAMARCKGVTVVAGGDSAVAVENLKLKHRITHVSTGGGAALALLEGLSLPGLEVINDKI